MSTVMTSGTSALEGCVFFPEISSVTDVDHGVRVRARAQGLRWHACEGRDGLVSMGA